MRTARQFLKQSITIRAYSVPSRAVAVVCLLQESPLAELPSWPFIAYLLSDSELQRTCRAAIPRTPNLATGGNSTKRRLKLHTRHAPPPASV